jgi:arginase
MAEAAWLELPYPEAAIVEAESLEEQSLALAADLPERPLVLGGCCCSHIGAVEGLAARVGRMALVWFDAHGDLNTPESTPSGNTWGMPLRMIVDSGAVDPDDVALVGARNLDPPEEEFLAHSRIHTGRDAIAGAIEGTTSTYVALDCDVVEPTELAVFMPEPGGICVADLEQLLADTRARTEVLGAGVSGLSFEPSNIEPVTRLTAALGL